MDKPLIPRSDGLPPNVRAGLVEVAGTISNVALLATVAGVVIGIVLVGLGTVLGRPQLVGRGWGSLLGSVFAAVAVVGLSAWIAWFGDHTIYFWH